MDYIRTLGSLVLDHRARRLTELLLKSAEEIYLGLGLAFRPRWTSSFLLIDRMGSCTVTEIAQQLRLTHPAVIGITDEMRDAGLVTEVRDPDDARRRILQLSPTARRLRPRLLQVWKALAEAQRRRFTEAGCDIIEVLDRVEDGLAKTSITAEVMAKLDRKKKTAKAPARIFGCFLALVAMGSLAGASVGTAQVPPAALNDSVVRAVGRQLADGYIIEATGRVMAESLEARVRMGGYRSLSPRALADSLNALLSRLSHDAHLGLHYRAPGDSMRLVRPAPPAGTRAPGPFADIGFCQVEVLPGRIGYIDLCGFSGAPEALAFADSMMASLSPLEALIIDLRQNRGGGPEMVRLLSTYMFDQPTHLVSTFMRGMDAPRERWTLEKVRGQRLTRVPVYLLTSRLTISAAESFAFGLRINRKITIVGEPTRGGGHFGEFVNLPGGFRMFLPRGKTYDPKTGEGWEATGLPPDVAVPAQEALTKALELIRNSSRPSHWDGDPPDIAPVRVASERLPV